MLGGRGDRKALKKIYIKTGTTLTYSKLHVSDSTELHECAHNSRTRPSNAFIMTHMYLIDV